MKPACIFALFAITTVGCRAAVAPVNKNACHVRISIYAGDSSRVESYIYGDWLTEDDAISQATALVDDGTQVAVLCRPPSIDRTEWALLGASLSVRMLDAYSTRRALGQGDHEMFLPDFISHHTPAMFAYGGAVVASEYIAASWLTRHHHARLAKILTAIDVAQDGFWATHNLFLKGNK